MSTESSDFIVRVRGIPFSAGKDELRAFFAGCHVRGGRDGVHLTYMQGGRPSGEAFLELETQEDLERALKKNKDYMGQRYIEVFQAQRSEYEWVKRRTEFDTFNLEDGVLRLRGCPFNTKPEDVIRFFKGLEIAQDGIVLPMDEMGRPGGEAYVQFTTKEASEEAMKLNRERMGHRYIEIFKSSLSEMRAAERGERPSAPPGRGGGRGGMAGWRPGPYDRSDGMGFGGRNVKGFGGRGFGRGGMGGMGGGVGMEGWGYGGESMGGGFGKWSSRGGGGTGHSWAAPKSGPGSDHKPSTGHACHMRGLPWRTTETDIINFFHPIVPAAVHLHYEPDGRATGTADVDFNTFEEATESMKKSGEYIESRYIDLFLNTIGPETDGPTMIGNSMISPRGSAGYTKSFSMRRPLETSTEIGPRAGPGDGAGDVASSYAANSSSYGASSSSYAGLSAATGRDNYKDEGWGGSSGWAGSQGWGTGANGYGAGIDSSSGASKGYGASGSMDAGYGSMHGMGAINAMNAMAGMSGSNYGGFGSYGGLGGYPGGKY